MRAATYAIIKLTDDDEEEEEGVVQFYAALWANFTPPVQAAAMRADAMLEKGDMEGYQVWKQVVSAVEVLLHAEPETVH